MQLNGRMVVVPQWVRETVKQSGLPLSSLVDLNQLSEYLSADDIISYHGVNKLFYALQKDFEYMNDSLYFKPYIDLFDKVDLVKEATALSNNGSNGGVDNKRLLSGIEEGSLVFLKESDSMDTLISSLVSTVYKDKAVTHPNVYVINLFHIENDTFGLSLKHYDGVASDSELSSIEDNMRLLHIHYRYEDVCQTTIFHRWCSKIKKNQQ